MQIVVKLEHKDFDGNKAVFDKLYEISSVINKRADISEERKNIPKSEVEKNAHINRDTVNADKPCEPSATPDTESPTYTLEEVRKAFGDLSKAKGKDAAKGILSEMGYAKVTEIPADKYPEAMEKIKAVK